MKDVFLCVLLVFVFLLCQMGYVEGVEAGKENGLKDGFVDGFISGISICLHSAILTGRMR